jgi:3-dehydroquinate synthetase
VRLLASLGLETDATLPPAEEIVSAIRMDKKYRGRARFVLLQDVGRPFVEDAVPEELLRTTLERTGSGAQAMGG